MITENPFSVLSEIISPAVMQIYVVAMFVLVVGGTLLDIIHKKSAKYFFENSKKARANATKTLSGSEKMSIAASTVASDILTSAEFCNFCNSNRRIAHLLTMYGFVLFVATSAIMVFGYLAPGSSTPGIWPFLWHLGAVMLCIGGYWFWFAIRVDVVAEGNPWYRIVRADLFQLSLLAMATPDLVLPAGNRCWLYHHVVPGAVPHFKHNIVWNSPVVKICPHVLQARGCLSKAHCQC